MAFHGVSPNPRKSAYYFPEECGMMFTRFAAGEGPDRIKVYALSETVLKDQQCGYQTVLVPTPTRDDIIASMSD